MDVSYHRPFLPGTSLEATAFPTAQASIIIIIIIIIIINVSNVVTVYQ